VGPQGSGGTINTIYSAEEILKASVSNEFMNQHDTVVPSSRPYVGLLTHSEAKGTCVALVECPSERAMAKTISPWVWGVRWFVCHLVNKWHKVVRGRQLTPSVPAAGSGNGTGEMGENGQSSAKIRGVQSQPGSDRRLLLGVTSDSDRYRLGHLSVDLIPSRLA
jgi:hypothetical protein